MRIQIWSEGRLLWKCMQNKNCLQCGTQVNATPYIRSKLHFFIVYYDLFATPYWRSLHLLTFWSKINSEREKNGKGRQNFPTDFLRNEQITRRDEILKTFYSMLLLNPWRKQHGFNFLVITVPIVCLYMYIYMK